MSRAYASFILAAVGLASLANTANADFEIEYTPTGNDIIYGCTVRYKIVGTRPNCNIIGYRWQYRKCGVWTDISDSPADGEAVVREIYVGTFDVRCGLTLEKGSGDQEPPTSPYYRQTTITIPPPDGIRVVEGLRQPASPNGGSVNIIFAIQCKGRDIAYGIGFPQEKVTNARDLPSGQPLKVSSGDFEPKEPDQTGRFYTTESGRQILDKKVMRANPNYYSRPPGPFFIRDQEIQMMIPDECNKYQAWPLKPKFTFTSVKNANGTWQIE